MSACCWTKSWLHGGCLSTALPWLFAFERSRKGEKAFGHRGRCWGRAFVNEEIFLLVAPLLLIHHSARTGRSLWKTNTFFNKINIEFISNKTHPCSNQYIRESCCYTALIGRHDHWPEVATVSKRTLESVCKSYVFSPLTLLPHIHVVLGALSNYG